jgi:hypothetical protein
MGVLKIVSSNIRVPGQRTFKLIQRLGREHCTLTDLLSEKRRCHCKNVFYPRRKKSINAPFTTNPPFLSPHLL